MRFLKKNIMNSYRLINESLDEKCKFLEKYILKVGSEEMDSLIY